MKIVKYDNTFSVKDVCIIVGCQEDAEYEIDGLCRNIVFCEKHLKELKSLELPKEYEYQYLYKFTDEDQWILSSGFYSCDEIAEKALEYLKIIRNKHPYRKNNIIVEKFEPSKRVREE